MFGGFLEKKSSSNFQLLDRFSGQGKQFFVLDYNTKIGMLIRQGCFDRIVFVLPSATQFEG